MSGPDHSLTDPLERSAVLTAYVAGRASSDEVRAVREAAVQDPQLVREIEFLQALRTNIKNESARSPGEFGWHRLKGSLTPQYNVDTSSWAMSTWARAALVAAVMVTAIESGLWWGARQDVGEGQHYQTLGQIPKVQLIQVKFQPNATQSEIQALLREIDAEIVSGPSAIGLYRLQLRSGEANADGMDRVIDALRRSPTIVSHAAKES